MLHSENLGIFRGSNGGNVTIGTGRNIQEGIFNKGETAGILQGICFMCPDSLKNNGRRFFEQVTAEVFLLRGNNVSKGAAGIQLCHPISFLRA